MRKPDWARGFAQAVLAIFGQAMTLIAAWLVAGRPPFVAMYHAEPIAVMGVGVLWWVVAGMKLGRRP